MPNVETHIDSSHLDQELSQKEDEVRRANLAMISAIRQTAQAGVLILQVAGVAIDTMFALYLETLLVGIEVIGAIAAGSFGVSLIFQGGQLIAMLILIRQIRQKRSKAAAKTRASIQLLRMGTYRIIMGPVFILIEIIEVIT